MAKNMGLHKQRNEFLPRSLIGGSGVNYRRNTRDSFPPLVLPFDRDGNLKAEFQIGLPLRVVSLNDGSAKLREETATMGFGMKKEFKEEERVSTVDHE